MSNIPPTAPTAAPEVEKAQETTLREPLTPPLETVFFCLGPHAGGANVQNLYFDPQGIPRCQDCHLPVYPD